MGAEASVSTKLAVDRTRLAYGVDAHRDPAHRLYDALYDIPGQRQSARASDAT